VGVWEAVWSRENLPVAIRAVEGSTKCTYSVTPVTSSATGAALATLRPALARGRGSTIARLEFAWSHVTRNNKLRVTEYGNRREYQPRGGPHGS
jgi:hypothetical protein